MHFQVTLQAEQVLERGPGDSLVSSLRSPLLTWLTFSTHFSQVGSKHKQLQLKHFLKPAADPSLLTNDVMWINKDVRLSNSHKLCSRNMWLTPAQPYPVSRPKLYWGRTFDSTRSNDFMWTVNCLLNNDVMLTRLRSQWCGTHACSPTISRLKLSWGGNQNGPENGDSTSVLELLLQPINSSSNWTKTSQIRNQNVKKKESKDVSAVSYTHLTLPTKA